MVHPDAGDQRIDIGHGRLRSLEELIDGWDRHVERLIAEGTLHTSDDSPESPLWGVHDYAAALHLRDFIDAACGSQAPGGDLAVRLTGADDHFRAFTKTDLSAWLPRAIPEAASKPQWWWRRIPKRGPVFEDLREYAAAVS